MPHEQHAQKILYDDTFTPWTKLFLLRTTHLLIRIITPCVWHWHGHGIGAQDGRLTNSLLEREKMVSTTSLLRCTTAQRSNMMPSKHNWRWPRDQQC